MRQRGTNPTRLLPGWRWLLLPLAPLYALVVRLRAWGFATGRLASTRGGIPVISVGNLTVGGTGKTPVTSWLVGLAERAAHAAEHPAHKLPGGIRRAAVVLSRGYGRRSRGDMARVCVADGSTPSAAAMGDEPAWLAGRHPEVPVYVDAQRARALGLATVWDAPAVAILDDGFQHMRLQRDLDVVLVDAQAGLGNGLLLPLGPLREPMAALRRADVVLLTKCNLGDPEPLAKRLRPWLRGAGVPIFRAEYRPVRLSHLEGGGTMPISALEGREVTLLSAIARPRQLAGTLSAVGATVTTHHALPDHDAYLPERLRAIEALMRPREEGAGSTLEGEPPGDAPLWITTEKDAVKLRGRMTGTHLWVIEMEVVPSPEAEAFFFAFLTRGGL